VSLQDGRTLVAQVDGGNGHSGHRSPELHFGLGARDAARPVPVAIAWRDRDGRVRSGTLPVPPGRRTIELTDAARLRTPGEAGR
jgi:hypothetical protein